MASASFALACSDIAHVAPAARAAPIALAIAIARLPVISSLLCSSRRITAAHGREARETVLAVCLVFDLDRDRGRACRCRRGIGRLLDIDVYAVHADKGHQGQDQQRAD